MSFWINDEYLNDVWERALGDPLPDERNLMEVYPSYLGVKDELGKHYGTCSRKVYYSKTMYLTSEPDIAGQITMNEGNIFEDYATKVFIKAGVAIKPNSIEGQTRIAIPRKTAAGNEYTVAGRIDLVYRNAQNKRAILDWKRIVSPYSGDDVFGTSKWNKAGPKAKDQNVIQMAVYAWWARDKGIYDCKLAYAYPAMKKGIVFNVNTDKDGNIYVDVPNDKDIEEIPQKEPYTIDGIFKEADAVMDAVVSQTPPEKCYDLFFSKEELNAMAYSGNLSKKWQDQEQKHGKVLKPYGQSPCAYCEYCSVCHGEDEAALAVAILKDK
jgi:CRISPR/Cas system-associated exonuclease Cas4 (RecB family)